MGDTHFERYIPEPHGEDLVPPEQIRRHILCTGGLNDSRSQPQSSRLVTGQVYHTLLHEREVRGIKDVAISRLEQISPFPYDLVRQQLLHYGRFV